MTGMIARLWWTLAAMLATTLGCGNGGGGAGDERDMRATTGEAGGGGAPAAAPTPTVVFLGTSLTAGYGLPSPDLAYPALIQKMIDSAGLPYRVVNAGVSGETSA